VEQGGFSEGEAVVISVRPENIYPSESGLYARVKGSVFMGTYLRVYAKTEGDDLLEFDVPVSEDKVFNKGDDVWLQVNGRMAILFSRPNEGVEEAVKLE
jgi:ABC-type Fe3+/spermidine/putrescine transport system ATPase subunit